MIKRLDCFLVSIVNGKVECLTRRQTVKECVLIVMNDSDRVESEQLKPLNKCSKKEENMEKAAEDTGLGRQLTCTLVINLVALLQGASVSSSSVVLHSLQEEVADLNSTDVPPPSLVYESYLNFGFELLVNAEEGSWVASTWVLAHLVFAPLAGVLSDKIGRRRALMIDTVLFCIGFTILATSHSIPCLILARFLLACPLVSQVNLAVFVL